MKIMIPASGGLDSTVLLHETLRDTSHDVVAVNYAEDYLDPGQLPAQRAAFDGVVSWLKANVREFDIETGVVKYQRKSGMLYDPSEMMHHFSPRDKQRTKTYWMKCRCASHGHNAARLGVDEVWLGLTTWNLNYIGYPHLRRLMDLAYEDYAGSIPLRSPWVELRADGNIYGRGRLEIRHALAPQLVEIVSPDSTPSETFDAFYDAICAGRTLQEVQEVEEQIEWLASIGRHFSKADPRTYRHNHHKTVIAELDTWKAWDAAGRPANEDWAAP